MSYRLTTDPETPETNAEQWLSDPDMYGQQCGLVSARFARRLEKERDAALAELAAIRAALDTEETGEALVEVARNAWRASASWPLLSGLETKRMM